MIQIFRTDRLRQTVQTKFMLLLEEQSDQGLLCLSRIVRKPVFGVSDQVRHNPGCTATEDGLRLEILDLGSKLYYAYSENKDADQLRGYCEADLRLCFRICKKPVFS